VESKAARLKNQPGPHINAAVAALKRALKREWSEGEPRLMADLLAGLGTFPAGALRDEQIKALEDIHRGAKGGTPDRLHLAHRLAQVLNGSERTDRAIDLLESALGEFQEARGGILPPSANEQLSTLVYMLGNTGRFARAEKILQSHRKHPFPQQQYLWLTQQLYNLYHRALADKGEVSLGKDQQLYRALEKALIADLGTTDHNHRFQLMQILSNVYRLAHTQKRKGVADDLRLFAFDKLPEILQSSTSNYDNIVNVYSQLVREVLGPEAGCAFLLTVIEREPAWLRYHGQDGWARHAYSLALWRSESKNLDAGVQERLLKLTLAEERRDLQSRQQRNRTIYDRQHTYYWAEKEKEFAKVAEEELAKQLQSGAGVQHIANYIYHGLGRPGRAIDALMAAHAQKLLDEGGRAMLVNFLHWQNRYADSIPLLVALIKERAENIGYRTQLMAAYFHTHKPAELAATLKDADAHFHKDDRWTEHAIAALAEACRACELYEQSVAYYKEVIPLHHRTRGRHGDGTLSSYYSGLARAYSGLKKTPEAVEAASAAIVSWGPNIHQHAYALENLRQVLRESPDLGSFIADLDKRGGETGMDSAIVRKALGEVLAQKASYAQAIVQLRRAAELQPNDAEINTKLLECFDKKGDKAGAVGQLLVSVQLSRRDLNLYKELGRRLTDLGQTDEAERAYTSIVEMMPRDAEGHMRLAEVREQQDRWDDAIHHWKEAVQLRLSEPTPLVGLAKAQIHKGQKDQAAETLAKLKAKPWPPRFRDVNQQINEIETKLPR
jgi:tetratricopeptide (TPR) repeat protein